MYYANAKQADVMAKEHHYDNAIQARAGSMRSARLSVYENLNWDDKPQLPGDLPLCEARKKLLRSRDASYV